MGNIDSTITRIITIIGQEGEKLSLKKSLSIKETIFHDILKRIKCNLEVLKILENNEHTIVPIRLLFRSIFGDIIEGIYLLSINQDALEKAIKLLDSKCCKSIKEWAETHYYLDRANNKTSLTHDKYMSPIDEYCKDCNNVTGNLSIKMMSDIIRNNPDSKIADISDLYSEYRFLSQTEHYSIKGRNFSYSSLMDGHLHEVYCSIIEHSVIIMIKSVN